MLLTPEQIERNRAFIKNLRENPKKAQFRMRDENGGRCCLCVAFDTARDMGFEGQDRDILPPDEMADWYGWDNRNPILCNATTAMEYNDGNNSVEPLSHAQIAYLFEQKYLNS